MRAEDADPLLAVFGDPVVMAAFEIPPFDRSQMEAWVRDNLAHQEQFGYGLFSVVLRESGDVIGDCGLETESLDGTVETELGYDLRRDKWGRRLATEAARAVARHAFDDLGLQRLISLVRPHNVRSARVAETVGMRPERHMRSSGVEYGVYSMAAVDAPTTLSR